MTDDPQTIRDFLNAPIVRDQTLVAHFRSDDETAERVKRLAELVINAFVERGEVKP